MKISTVQLRKIIAEELEEIRLSSPENRGFNPERVAGSPKMDVPTLQGSVEDRLDSLEGQFAGMASDLQWIRNKLSTPEGPLEEKDDKWIQDAEKDIERRGTKGVCTGENFGSEKCPPGSKRYNLAKTFKKMAKDKKE